MQRRRFSREFKIEAVKLVREGGADSDLLKVQLMLAGDTG
jgi:transposase-like protein